MTSPDRTRFVAIAAGAGLAALLSLTLASELAFAEGTFFKKRRAAETTAPSRAATPAPAPQPEPMPRAIDATGGAGSASQAETGGDAPGAGASLPVAAPPPSPSQPSSASEVPPTAPPANVTGVVQRVPSTDTLVVGSQSVRLAGVNGDASMAAGLQGWLRSQGGQVQCTPAAGSRYRCVTANNSDVGYVVLFNGAGRADGSASPEYRQAEAQARAEAKGVWAR